jgi:hypothetical protein
VGATKRSDLIVHKVFQRKRDQFRAGLILLAGARFVQARTYTKRAKEVLLGGLLQAIIDQLRESGDPP